jgi:hypothetical protein
VPEGERKLHRQCEQRRPRTKPYARANPTHVLLRSPDDEERDLRQLEVQA